MTRTAFAALCEAFRLAGGREFSDMGNFYAKIADKVLVRREDPKKVFELLTEKKDIPFVFDEKITSGRGDAYANCAVYDKATGDGLKDAFQEGWSQLEGVATVMGFEKGEDMTIEAPENSVQEIGGLERNRVRIARGVIHSRNVKFVVVRAPKKLLGDSARDSGSGKFVFRGFLFDSKEDERRDVTEKIKSAA